MKSCANVSIGVMMNNKAQSQTFAQRSAKKNSCGAGFILGNGIKNRLVKRPL